MENMEFHKLSDHFYDTVHLFQVSPPILNLFL